MSFDVPTLTNVPIGTKREKMPRKTNYVPYERPVRIFWKIVAGPCNLHPINLYDLVFDDYDLKIRKIDLKTEQFIRYVK